MKGRGVRGGESQVFGMVLVFLRGVFLRNSPGPLRELPAGALPAPQCRAARRELGFPLPAAPPASACRPLPLAEKGKSVRPGWCGPESLCREGAGRPGKPYCPLTGCAGGKRCFQKVAPETGILGPPLWSGSAAGNPRAAERIRPQEAVLSSPKGRLELLNTLLKSEMACHRRAAPPPVPTSAAFPCHFVSKCARTARASAFGGACSKRECSRKNARPAVSHSGAAIWDES